MSFPDFPGCISAGDTFDTVIARGTEALRGHVQAMAADGEPIPEPIPLAQLRADPEFAEDFADAVVDLIPLLLSQAAQKQPGDRL